jgi:pilus assembly protein CpaC
MRANNPAAPLAPFAALLAGAALAVGASHPVRAQTFNAQPVPAAAAAAAVKALAPAGQPAAAPAPSAPAAPAAHMIRSKPAASPAEAEPGVLRVDLSTAGPSARTINLPQGKSAVVELPVDARDVLVTNPAVADAMLRSRRRISVLGVAAGDTDAVFFDEAGKRILTLDIHVGRDPTGLADSLERLLPGAKVRVDSVNDSLVLAGEVASSADADKAVRLAQRFVGKPEQVVNLLTISGRDQVMIKVRVVEIQRSIIKQLGFNTAALYKQDGLTQYLFQSTATYAINQKLLGGAQGAWAYQQTNPNQNGLNQGAAVIQAFERVGLVRTLAEPNLTAISGESAKFLAGGEYPVPVGQDNQGRVTVEFKPYGVGLNFTPVVMSEGRISLKISTEVSELSSDGAFTMSTGTSSALTIPSLKLRRTETTVELSSGGALMIAGLIQQQTKQDIDAVPGLANVPVLGTLFRSRDYLSGETELAVIVTPYLVKGVAPDQLQTPVDGLEMADDMTADLLGKLNRSSNVPPAAVAGKTLQGPYGYVIE